MLQESSASNENGEQLWKELSDNEAKILFFYFLHINHVKDYIYHYNCYFDNKIL